MILHEKYMKRCLELAQKGFWKTAPNPMVGCVIVGGGKIISEGYHPYFGGPHAEANAIRSVRKKDLPALKNATLYVNLEPCSHFGKTPPCSDLIIRYKIRYVVIGAVDPNPLVAGKGIRGLISSGCDVKVGVMEEACRELNKRFFTFWEKKRPYIILKWAESKDKYMGVARERVKITGSKADEQVHYWRSAEQAIMVGTNTVLTDNPRLTARNTGKGRRRKGQNPLRIVTDKNLKIPASAHILDKKVPTLVLTGKKGHSVKNLEYVRIDFSKNILEQAMKELYNRQVQSLIVEGGPKLLHSFISEGLWDEARIITSAKRLSELTNSRPGIPSPRLSGNTVIRNRAGKDTLLVICPFFVRNTSESFL